MDGDDTAIKVASRNVTLDVTRSNSSKSRRKMVEADMRARNEMNYTGNCEQ